MNYNTVLYVQIRKKWFMTLCKYNKYVPVNILPQWATLILEPDSKADMNRMIHLFLETAENIV